MYNESENNKASKRNIMLSKRKRVYRFSDQVIWLFW
jgi:hypothetical protein